MLKRNIESLLAQTQLEKIAKDAKETLTESGAGEIPKTSGIITLTASWEAARGADIPDAIIAPAIPWQRLALALIQRAAPAIVEAAIGQAFDQNVPLELSESAAARVEYYRDLLKTRDFRAGSCKGKIQVLQVDVRAGGAS